MDYVKKGRFRKITPLAAGLVCSMALFAGGISALAAEDNYSLTFMIDGEVFARQEYQAGETVAPPEAPEKENFIFSEWQNLPKMMPESDTTVTGIYNFEGALAENLENIYEFTVEPEENSPEEAATAYLRIDENGNFVFSEDTDFSLTDLGAGKAYRRTPSGDLVSGVYSVDISWSPMADMLTPMLEIDAEDMTFRLYDSTDPDTEKGNGTVTLEDGAYTLHYADGENTTGFTYGDESLTFTSRLWYGNASFNSADESGNFVPYSAALSETSDSETEETDSAEKSEEESERYFLVYYIAKGEAVAEGDYVAEFEITQEGRLHFIDPLWYGDRELTDVIMEISEAEIEKDIDASAIVSKSAPTEATESQAAEEQQGSGSIRYGTYGGTHTTTAMGDTLTYGISLTLSENGTYSYSVQFIVMGETHNESESGTFTVNRSSITLTAGDGTVISGTISGSSITLTRYVSSFSFSPVTITLTYGASGSPSGNATIDEGQGGTNRPEQTGDNTEENEEEDTDTTVNQYGLAGGKYYVDISWSPMAEMFDPVLEIDAANMTFKLYNNKDSDALKGEGTITHKNGVFTLKYEDGKKTTFTQKDGTISFTSKLWYGAASFNNVDSNGKFQPFTAEAKKKPAEETEGGNTPSTEPATEPSTALPAETETPGETETDAGQSLKTGTYTGTMQTSAMGGMTYKYSLTFDGKGGYEYKVDLTTPYGTTTQTESGTYTVNNGAVTLTVSDSDILEAGTQLSASVIGDTLTMNRKLASMAADSYQVSFTYAGETPGETEPATEPEESEPETETETEGESETETESESESFGSIRSGTYAVDMTGTSVVEMMGMKYPMLVIDAEARTFQLYEETEGPGMLKGKGTVSYENGVYTLEYDNGKTTTFTCKEGQLTFTSCLYYNGVKLNNWSENNPDVFIPYQGQIAEDSEPETDESETESETETEPSSALLQAGTYGGEMATESMGGMTYYYFVTFDGNGNYQYKVDLVTPYGEMTETESGTYKANGNAVILTAAASDIIPSGTQMTGTVSGSTVTIHRKLASMAAGEYDAAFALGYTAPENKESDAESTEKEAAMTALDEAGKEIAETLPGETLPVLEQTEESEMQTEKTDQRETETVPETETVNETGWEAASETEEQESESTEALTDTETVQESDTSAEKEGQEETTPTEMITETSTEAAPATETPVETSTEVGTETAPATETPVETSTEVGAETAPATETPVETSTEVSTEAAPATEKAVQTETSVQPAQKAKQNTETAV